MIRIVNVLKFPVAVLPLLLTASACLQNDWEEKENREKELIQSYLTTNGITEDQKTEGGIYYVPLRTGTGYSPLKDNYVIISYVGRYLDGNVIHETTYDSLKNDWADAEYYTHYVYGPMKFKYGYSIAGINEGLSMMKEGGKARLVLPSDKAFYDFNPLVYDIELLKVIRDPVAYEDSVLTEYLSTAAFDTITTADNGIYFKETLTPNPGDQRTVNTGDTVYFRFNGRLVDGFGSVIKDNRVFDTNMDDTKPVKYVFKRSEIPEGMLFFPEGLKIALDSMRVGTHATAVLPYSQAFKDAGVYSSVYGYTIVPKYQTVVYDIVVEDIRSATEQ